MGEPVTFEAIEPDEWFVVFHTRSPRRWLGWLACGRFKHVSAFAYYPGFKAWLIYDASWARTRLVLLAHAAAAPAIAEFTRDCAIVKFTRTGEPMGLSSRLGFYCVPAVKHLLGVRCGALRPDALYRHILRHGGTLIDGRQQDSGHPD